MVRTGDQKTVIATFRHDTSRNLDPALHTHAVIANMVQGGDGKWRSMANEKLYDSKMLLGALYRSELAAGLARLGYGIEKTHADGRFEIAGVSREVVEAFSTRRAEIEAAVAERGGGETANDQRLAQRAALMTRAAKRDVDRDELRESWEKQAASLGFDARGLAAEAMANEAGRDASPEAKRDARRRPRRGSGRERRRHVRRGGGRGWRHVRAADAGGGGGGMGRRPSLGARGGVRPHRPARRRACLEPGRGGGRRHRARGRGPRGRRHAARRPAAGRRRAAHHRPRGRRRARDDRADAGGRAPRRRADARPRRRQGASGRPPYRRAEGGRQARPVVRRPHRRRPGLCRLGQDHHVEARAHAPGEEGLRGPGARALCVPPRARSKARPALAARPCSAFSPATPASPKGA